MNPTAPSLSPFASFVLWMSFIPAASGAVFQSSVSVSPTTLFGANYAIGASTEPNSGGLGAGLLLFADAHLVLRPVTLTVGVGHAWYRTLDGRAIDPAFVAANSPFASNIGIDLSGEIQMTLGGSFVLGFWLDANIDRTPNSGDRFGWARLRYTAANGLTLLDNAIEDTGAGIVAGTTNAVPEPSPFLLLAPLLVLGLLRRVSRKRGKYGRQILTRRRSTLGGEMCRAASRTVGRRTR